MTSRRWPHFVYGEGEEPDYRFSSANERTYLAWIHGRRGGTGAAFLAVAIIIATAAELVGVLR